MYVVVVVVAVVAVVVGFGGVPKKESMLNYVLLCVECRSYAPHFFVFLDGFVG